MLIVDVLFFKSGGSDTLWAKARRINKRVAFEHIRSPSIDAILEVDAAVDLFDRNDIEKVEQAKESALATQAQREDFNKDYFKQRREINAAADAKFAAGQSKAPAPLPQLALPDHHISQAEAKKLTPPGTYVWQRTNAFRKEWCGRYPISQYGQVTESFAKHGNCSVTAWHACLRGLWLQYCKFNGWEHSRCPVKGLLV